MNTKSIIIAIMTSSCVLLSGCATGKTRPKYAELIPPATHTQEQVINEMRACQQYGKENTDTASSAAKFGTAGGVVGAMIGHNTSTQGRTFFQGVVIGAAVGAVASLAMEDVYIYKCMQSLGYMEQQPE